MTSALNKLRFQVVSFSSEDNDYPADQLNTVNPSTKGWQSVRFCPYPQELGFELDDGNSRLTQIQILSHQSKISTKIEIFVGQGATYYAANFKRLGYLSLDSNERSSYTARELKTVFIDHVGKYIKLIINENHINKQNIYNQVGIIAVSLMGVPEDDETDDYPNGKPSRLNQILPNNGSPKQGGYNNNPYNDLSYDMNLDPQTANKLRQLADAKSKAIDEEDYLTAKQIKYVEQELKSLGSKLAQLDMAKSEAVRCEDYDLAKEIKDETDELRGQIEKKIMAIKIPGLANLNQLPKKVPKFAPAKDEVDYDSEFGAHPSARGGNGSRAGSANKRVPLNVDDIVVGGGNNNNSNLDDYSQKDKKAVKVEELDHGYDHKHSDDQYDEDDLPIMERPIKLKAVVDYNLAGEEDGYQNNAQIAIEKFPPGQHPLEGVSNFMELPTPEAITGKSKEVTEQGGITSLIGDYRARCLFSKAWILREAVLNKIHMMLDTNFLSSPNGISGCINALAAIIRVGVEDKIQQVLFNTIALMDDVLKATRGAKLPRSTMSPLFEPIIVQLVEKLADGNARLREGGRKGLDMIAASNNIGPTAVASYTLKALPPKQKTAWRPIVSRLQLLTDLVTAYGIGGNSGLNTDALLNFSKSVGAFLHSNGEVRDAARDLVVAIQKVAGTPAVESIFTLLRPKQLEEYQHAFEGGGNKRGDVEHRTDKHLQHPTHNPGGKVPTTAAKVADNKNNKGHNNGHQNKQSNADSEGPQDFTSCMFCGVQNKNWTENDLDVHYWKDCPLLISCPSCAQIVEIAGLPEHLLDECDTKDTYVPCDVTGLAIRKTEIDSWKNGPNYTPPPHNCMYCPLCLASVQDSDEAWLQHLTTACPRNTRTNGA